MYLHEWVLAITKRTADLCAMQPLLSAAGLELVTATNIDAAEAALKSLTINAVIVCQHSWTAEERDRLGCTLADQVPSSAILMRCPGCTEAGNKSVRRKLRDFVACDALISYINRRKH